MASLNIHEIGEALYGPLWQSELSRATGISPRHMRRLAAGEAVLTEAMLVNITAVAQRRLKQMQGIAKRLDGRKS